MDGVAAVQSIIDRYNEVMAMWAEPDADYDKIGAAAGRARGQDRRRRRLEPRAQRRDRHGRPALPARRRRRHARCRAASGAASRCAGCCSAGPTCCCSTSRPTTSTPRASTGSSSSCRTTRAPSWRSPTTATSSTTSPSGSSSSTAAAASRSRATTRRGWSRSRSAWPARSRRNEARRRTLERELEWVRMAPKARQAKGKARLAAYDKLQAEAEAARGDDQPAGDRHPARPAPRRHGHRGRRPAQGLRRPAADRGPLVLAAAGRHRRHHRPQRRRQDDAVQDAHRRRSSPTPARSRSATPCS